MNNQLPIIDSSRSKLLQPFVVSPRLRILLDTISTAGGTGILVGGCVRDHLLGRVAKDLDLEVYGIDALALEQLLTKHFSVVAVGKAFGIFKVSVSSGGEKESFDVALPRTENKIATGHKGFVVSTNPNLSFKDASARRDFTINAMGIDVVANELIDPHGGQADLKTRTLRHVSEAFKEDPLRVLRAAQFCSRFSFTLHETTIKKCKELTAELSTLSRERIFEEFKKLLLSGKPSIGLEVLRQTNALTLFLDLAALIGCEQDKKWHPEGDVWIHSLMVSDEAAKIVAQSPLPEDEKLIVVTAALCHDLGKPATTIPKDGRIKSPGHEQAGVDPTIRFLEAIGFPKKYYDDVTTIVRDHLKPYQLYAKRDEVSDSAIRRLASRVNIERLLMVSKADFLGRTTDDALSGHDPSEPWLRQKVLDLLGQSLSPEPILLGRHLIALGQKPGAHFSQILKDAFEAQMDGEFVDEGSALQWLKKKLSKAK